MPDFWYSALTDSGTVQEGVLSAPDESALESQPRQRGAFLLRAVKRMITLLQPLLIAIVGGVILMIALAIIVPILNICAQIGVRR
jgi:type II secretory pathway component PulF